MSVFGMLKHTGRQRGLTLIELMVALVLSSMLMTGVVTVFLANKTTYRTQEGLAQLQENGRMALMMMSRDFRNAGYYGCNQLEVAVNNVLNNSTGYVWNFENVVDGFEATGGSWEPTLDGFISGATTESDASITLSTSSDVLTLRFVKDVDARVSAHATSSSALTVTGVNGIESGDILLASNCENAVIFQATGVTGSVIAHATGGSAPGNADADLGLRFVGASVSQLSTRSYVVATGSYSGALPALWRIESDGDAEELLQGIDSLQVLYGVDTDGDRMVNAYVTANNVAGNSVVSLRIEVLASALNDNVVDDHQTYLFNGGSVTATDKRLRQSFSTTVAIRNVVP